uniref:Integrator complex subunit 6-like beta-barrel domain-containing protein n=1 Tax=Anopheles culicifacies TaxID=139723 RepID=A0A182MNM9_9DIPT
MTVIVFLLDNTPAMLQQTMMNGVRCSYMDIAKQTVELFLDQRESQRASQQDKKNEVYLLLTYDIPPNNVKVRWNGSMVQFRKALNTLQCTGIASENVALSNVLQLLNQERVLVGVDTYGYGRCPFNNMFSFIILITTYHQLPFVTIPSTPTSLFTNGLGSHLTNAPYRWDQRLFALILGSSKYSLHTEKMTLAMGGWLMLIRSKRKWYESITRLAKSIKLQLMVNVVHETGQCAHIAETTITRLEPSNCVITHCDQTWRGSWPFPESEFLCMEQNYLTPRDAFPKVRILPECYDEPVWMVNFPVDKFELRERHASAQRISLRTNDRNKIWPVVNVSSTGRNELPFGYVKQDAERTYLFVLAYNYPELYRVMVQHFPSFNARNVNFIYAMKHYLYTVPSYYRFYLVKALKDIVENRVLDLLFRTDGSWYLNRHISNDLDRIRQDARLLRKKLYDYVPKQQDNHNEKQQETAQLIEKHPLVNGQKHTECCTVKTIVVPNLERSTSSPDYRKLHAIDRKDLLDMMNRMRNDFYYPENHINPSYQNIASLRSIDD